MSGALAVYEQLRERWQLRGLDYWTTDPTDRAGDDWFRVSEIDAEPARLDALIAAFGARAETDNTKAAASLLGKRISSLIPFPATVTWMRARRVPIMRPDTTWVQFVDGAAARVAVDDIAAWVLANDELAGAPDCIVVDDDTMLDHLATVLYEQTMSAVIDALHRHARTGRRHLWGNLALPAINSALWAGEAPDPWTDGRRLLDRLEPVRPTVELLDAERTDADPFTLALRRTCCLAYETPHGYCASCSLLDRDERIIDLTARIGDAWRDRDRT
ncbi:MAG: (2Fe-2S)-binding protein [Actinomycetota bacterium]